jgi:LmbE family N-acetylglucosaminyl deacetylase
MIKHIKYFFNVWLLTAAFSLSVLAQAPKKLNTGEIYAEMERLQVLASALYVAAHPDDENTRMISFLANDKKASTTYLSLTRGDGGQNLIGSEIGGLLGALRTQELLMARSVDNGSQMFSRANDFGYSKNAEETIRIWDTEKVKADVVWAIRKLRPDVIINRFDHRTSGETHGHHTASAILSYELFDKINDPMVYPEQLSMVKTWAPRRLFFNTSSFFFKTQNDFDKADKSSYMSMDVGTYFPLIGKSNTEIAALSRSKHKCQGFGVTGSRGSQIEYLELLRGDLPPGKSDVFEGINTTWTRVPNGAAVGKLVAQLLKTYDFKDPSKSIPLLVKIHNAIQKTGDDFWKEKKTAEVKNLIGHCAGLYLEAKTNTHRLTANEKISLDVEAINRSNSKIKLKRIFAPSINVDTVIGLSLLLNERFAWSKLGQVTADAPLTAPYWMTQKGSLGLFKVDDPSIIGNPETKKTINVKFVIDVEGQEFTFVQDVVYKFNSPEVGESYRPLEVVPVTTIAAEEPVYIFNNDEVREVNIIVHAWNKDLKGVARLPLPVGWRSEPDEIPFSITTKGDSKKLIFKVFPPKIGSEVVITPQVIVDDKTYNMELVDIPYDHIPYQTIIRPSEFKLSKIDIQIQGRRIAYIAGAGDEIPVSLRQIGYDVTIVKPEEIAASTLLSYDALVIGVRAYNTEEPLKFKQKEILSYVEQGGTVVVQYNTTGNLLTKELGPYPFTLSRQRVTVEEAEMRMIKPDHPILNIPNKITSKDFEGWVQERGLYFPGEWDAKYETILSCNDPGEKPMDSSILVADYGKGKYIYTGLSFFRELPAGVSGAFRLLANLISYGNESRP